MKTWKKPKLIALVRNRPEEAVLSACKFIDPTGPNSLATTCTLMIVQPEYCILGCERVENS